MLSLRDVSICAERLYSEITAFAEQIELRATRLEEIHRVW